MRLGKTGEACIYEIVVVPQLNVTTITTNKCHVAHRLGLLSACAYKSEW